MFLFVDYIKYCCQGFQNERSIKIYIKSSKCIIVFITAVFYAYKNLKNRYEVMKGEIISK